MSQQFKPRVSVLQPAQIIGGKRVPLQDQDCKYFTHTRNTLAVHKSVEKIIRSVKDFSVKRAYISNKISPFLYLQYKIPFKGQKALLQINILAGFIL